jgi:sialate O-acetylesterase
MRYQFHKEFLMLLILVSITFNGLGKTSDGKVRIACLGNSVTYGYGLEDRETGSYPAQLQKILGDQFLVGNFGVNGATLLSKGHNPYIKTETYRQALDFHPDMVVIDLGLNDTDPRNWPLFRDEFISDYQNLIRSFQTDGGRKVKIFVCRMTPIFHTHARFKSGTRDWFGQIQETVERVAVNMGVPIIDLHTPLYSRPDLFADALHPDKEGTGIIARTISGAISGNYGGLKLLPVYSEHMVFQQSKPVEISGTANSNDHIKINFGQNTGEYTTGADGVWKVVLPQLPAGGPYPLRIFVNNKLEVDWKDILVGEVWFCSGQSNMEFRLDQSENGKDEIEKAVDDNLRLMNYHAIAATSDEVWDPVTLAKINRLDYFRGNWQKCTSTETARFSAIAYHFGKQLREKLLVPVGLIQVAVGGAPAESFIDRRTIEFNPKLVDVLYNWRNNDFIMEWCRQRGMKNISINTNLLQRHPFMPAYIFEAGISHFKEFPVKGVIWYQGESNAHNPEHHEVVFPELIRSWRQFWNNKELPFIFAQLSSIQRPGWERFRESQRHMAGMIPNTAMVVTSDLGDSLNVHPIRKREVGERFALQALKIAYGEKVVPDGPLPLKATRYKGAVVITFIHSHGLKTSDSNPLRELEATGSNGIFHPVTGEIRNDKIIFHTDNQYITKIRYGWRPFSRGNLVNEAALPASTFELEIH